MKPHIKVIQRNGVDIFVTSSINMKSTRSEQASNRIEYLAMRDAGMRNMSHDARISMASSLFGCNPRQTSGIYK
jgi:hypothetical protein